MSQGVLQVRSKVLKRAPGFCRENLTSGCAAVTLKKLRRNVPIVMGTLQVGTMESGSGGTAHFCQCPPQMTERMKPISRSGTTFMLIFSI